MQYNHLAPFLSVLWQSKIRLLNIQKNNVYENNSGKDDNGKAKSEEIRKMADEFN